MDEIRKFESRSRALLGGEYADFAAALEMPPAVSIRLNPRKNVPLERVEYAQSPAVPWCGDGRYLSSRPPFTYDPLFHAGAYYVQEAASMFIEQVARQVLASSSGDAVTALDLCAAPGGKSTHLLSLLPAGSLLISNETVRRRCMVLAENMAKWGLPGYIVTGNDPGAFGRLPRSVDLILADLPCSGEGLFRKDPASRAAWSVDNVRLCASRQRRIIHDVWDALRPGGWLIYSTCTYNTEENEENVCALAGALDAEIVPVSVKPEWKIGGSVCYGIPVCRFYPHRTQGEGFFVALLRKRGECDAVPPGLSAHRGRELYRRLSERLHIVASGIDPDDCPDGRGRAGDRAPSAALAMSVMLRREDYPSAELTYEEAIRYLRREPLIMPSGTAKGYVLVTFCGLPLGFVKNIGSRANNLYPMEWRIRNRDSVFRN